MKVAVATPRANGQGERLNQSVLNALLVVSDESRWDENLRDIQLAINNTLNRSTGKTLSQLMLGYIPRGGEDATLREAVQLSLQEVVDLVKLREDAASSIEKAQVSQKWDTYSWSFEGVDWSRNNTESPG